MSSTALALSLPDSVATDRLGAALGRNAHLDAAGGTVLYLRGELGAGKTTCARSLLRAVGVRGLIRSPTYTLLETYETVIGLILHLDLYRLNSAEEVEELGLRDHLEVGTLLMVEWPERGTGALPHADLELDIEYADSARQARLRSRTSSGASWMRNLENDDSLRPYLSNLT